MRYLVLIRLNKSTGKITKATTVFNKSYIIGMSLEILFALIHPNLGLKGMDTLFTLLRCKVYDRSDLVLDFHLLSHQ